MINPVWLRSYCTLVEVGSFTRTAQRLHMTQSGVSQHLRRLEGFLGLALIQRQGKQFSLTEAGEKLYREAQDIVDSLSTLGQRLGEDPAYEGQVNIQSPGSVGLRLYPKLLHLQQEQPKLTIDYRFAPNDGVEESILDYRADVGFMTRPSTLTEIASQSVGNEELFLVTSTSVEKLDWSTLLQLGYIGHPDGAHQAGLLLGANFPEFQHVDMFTLKGFSNQISLILEPVSMGLGFTVLPAHAVNAFHKFEQIKIHRLEHSVNEGLFLVTRRHKAIPARVQTVINTAAEWL
ncbi:LysR family transcriptional regulator [Microbulbifer sp. GL-2]|uniref:LysR family transcriptional regulator n=1 Tax=Microbulbifer sp. GL-2 TaxID=2591606 RepID=UPI0011628E5B|nr:LysR family transcriptional regulator [Microbulbifer sp. GL-2]BBM00207.1 LysR family transcriptional regulator [Microbulbifer sp. GL-2]